MTFLGTLLKMYLRADQRQLQQVASAIGKHPSQVSRIVSGERCHLEHDELDRLVHVVSPDDRDRQANMVVAYLLDCCPDTFRNEVRIENVRDIPNGLEPQPARSSAAAPH